jgi:hypothetical protein
MNEILQLKLQVSNPVKTLKYNMDSPVCLAFSSILTLVGSKMSRLNQGNHWLTFCVLTVAGILDAAVHESRLRMNKAGNWDGGATRLGGKLV